MFKNCTPYRYSGPALAATLTPDSPFVACLPAQDQSFGFVPHETQLIVRIERKTVPKQALDKRVNELADKIKEMTSRKASKKARAELKEQAYFELLPRAFSKTKDVQVTFLEDYGLVLIGSTSAADIDAIVALLIESQEGLSISLLNTQRTPAAVMAEWMLSFDGAPAPFQIGRACLLDGQATQTGKVRYDNHALDSENVRDHLRQGKAPEELNLTYDNRVGFTLTAGMTLRGVELLDLVFEGKEVDSDGEVELLLWRAELGRLLDALICELGGVAS